MLSSYARWLGILAVVMGCAEGSGQVTAQQQTPIPAQQLQQQAPDKIATALRNSPIFPFAVRSVAFSPDGNLLAAGTGDGVVRLWNVKQKRLVHTIRAHELWTFDLAFTPGGDLISGGGDDLVRLINPKTGEIRQTFHDHENDLHGVAVTPNGDWLISGSDDTRVLARPLRDDTAKSIELGRHRKQVTSVAVAPNGKLAVSSSRDRTIRLWDLEQKKLLREIGGHEADVMSVAFSPDGERLVTGGYDKTVRVWSVATSEQLALFDRHEDWVFAVLFSPDGKYIFSGAGDDRVRRFRLSDETFDELPLTGDVADLALSPDGKLLAAGTADGTVRLIGVNEQELKLLHDQFKTTTQTGLAAPPRELTVDQYLAQHRAIQLRGDQWSETVAGTSAYGDAYTLHLLKKFDEKALRPDEAEVRQRVIQQIEKRRGDAPERVRVDEIGPLLLRAAAADLQCHPLETSLGPWLIQHLRDQSSDSKIRRQLELIRKQPPVPPTDDQFLFGSAAERIKVYVNKILK